MSLLAELEELQRCLEGTADSDSEDASPAAGSRISEKEDANRNEDEPTGFIRDSVPIHTQADCRNSGDTQDEIGLATASVVTGKCLEQSAAKSDRLEPAAKVSRGKILPDGCTKKDSPSEVVEMSTLKQEELKTHSDSEGMVPDTSVLTRGSINTDSSPKRVIRLEGDSPVSEPETPPAAGIEDTLKLEDVADVSRSPFPTKEDASTLQAAASESEGMKLPSVPDSGPVSSKHRKESSSPLQATQSTANSTSALEVDRHTGGRVQLTPAICSLSAESKIALEEVRISNNRPVIRILSVSPDSKKSRSETAAVSAGSPASLSVGGGRQGGPANSSPGVTKRNVSFETGSAVCHVLGEEQPAVVINTCKQESSKQVAKNEEGTSVKKRKLSAGADSRSVNAASSQRVPETSELVVKQKLCDISVVEADIRVDSGCPLEKKARVRQDSEGKNTQDFWFQLGLEKVMAAEASEEVAVGMPLLRKRRVASDPVACADDNKSEGLSLSGAKRRKLSASELSGPPEEPLNSESAGSVTMAQTSLNKIAPTTSAGKVTMSPQGFDQDVRAVPSSKSRDEHEVEDEDADLEKEDHGKEFLKAKVVLKKLNIPVLERLPPVLAQDANAAKTKPQHLQKALEKVSQMLQVTLTGGSPPKKRKTLRPKKLQDGLEEPIKGQSVVKRPKVIDKPTKQKILGKRDQQKVVRRQVQQKMIRKASQQKIAGKRSQHKCPKKSKPQKTVGKSSRQKLVPKAKQQKLVLKTKQQKTVRKPARGEQKTVSRTKTVQKSPPSKRSNIAIRIASSKEKVVRKTGASSKRKTKLQVPRKSRTDLQRAAPSIIAKKTMKQVTFRNPKHKQSLKPRPEGQRNKNATSKKNKQNKFDAKEKRGFLKENMREISQLRENGMVPLETQMTLPASGTLQQKSAAAMNRPPEVKKFVTVKKPRLISVDPGKPDGCCGGAEDEWIVEVLLDDSEIDMMTVGQDANISKVSSSDDRPKDLLVSPSDLGTGHSLECDSSTDTNKRKSTLAVGKNVSGNICGSESNMVSNVQQKGEVPLPSVTQFTPSCSAARQSNISAEQKMAEMRKAIGDLERIADRSMLRLKAEERQVVYLTNRLYEYECDKHHVMLRKILSDAAPGPKQNPHAEFILDLVLSYCPEEDAAASS